MTVETMVLGPVSANTYIVTDDISCETAIIDCGECTPELISKLNGKNVKYILLTHGHADHILGVYDLKQDFPEAKIVIHKKDADCLTNEMMSIAFSIAPHMQKNIEPDITVEEGDVISLGSLEFKVMHTPDTQWAVFAIISRASARCSQAIRFSALRPEEPIFSAAMTMICMLQSSGFMKCPVNIRFIPVTTEPRLWNMSAEETDI